MKSEPIIVVNNALLVVFTSLVPAGEHLSYFIVPFKLVEIAESFNVIGIISEDTIKYCITVHESLGMHRNDGYTLSEI